MKNEIITIKKEDCGELAERIFLSSSGLDKETEKNANVRESAFKVRTQIEALLDIRAVFSFYDGAKPDGRILDISGQKFMCNPFDQIDPDEVKAAVPFFLTAGDIPIGDMQMSDQVIADIWTNAYIQAAEAVFREYLEKQYGTLSDRFGPGLYGMSEGSARRLARLADMREIGISLTESGMMIPAKSCCGLYFTVEDTYRKLDAECLYCKGNSAGCAGCSVRHRRDMKKENREKQLIKLPPDFSADDGKTGYGIAVDIGTTTLVVMLWDLAGGSLKAVASDYNPQREYGADVITRLVWASKKENGPARMREKVLSGINSLIDKACSEAGLNKDGICRAVVAGNTVMSQFFAGKNPSGLAEAPFTPAYDGPIHMSGSEAGLQIAGDAEVLLVSNIAGHVGGDITAGMIATGISGKDQMTLFIDIGTNGEIVLMSDGQGVACSAAAGPAFEGAGISCGMRAAEGAVNRVYLEGGQIGIGTIGGKEPAGICGSGLIDAVSVMLETGAMDRTGRINDKYEIPGTPICITQKDVRQFQLAKGAIAAGIQICLDEMGKSAEGIDQIIIGGAFGAGIDVRSAMNTGLIPKTDEGKVTAAGNTAGAGASMILLSAKKEREAEKIPGLLRHIELAGKDDFQELFLKNMGF